MGSSGGGAERSRPCSARRFEGHKESGETDSDVVYEHLVEAMGAETGADNVGDGDCRLDVLVADFFARDSLTVTEQSDRLPGVACKERHAAAAAWRL